MSQTESGSSNQGIFQKHHFLIRRLHSLSGIVPIGVFLVNHLITNSSLLWGKYGMRGDEAEGLSVSGGGVKYFQEEVSWINTQIPHLLLIEVSLWLAIAFHSVLGIYYATGGKGNLKRYPHQDNWRYSLQRISGYLGVIFILYHVATLRWGWTFLVPAGTEWSHHFSASTLASALQGSTEGFTLAGIAVSVGYFVGVSLLVFHFANGLWTAAITWGLTVSESAQRRWGFACAGLGAMLMLAAWSSLAGALMIDQTEAKQVETQLILDEHGAEHLEKILEEHHDADDHSEQAPAPTED